jgi:imidazolonepropionase-like amidohydrolase
VIDAHTHITYFWDRAPGTRPRGQRRLPAVTVFLAQDNARRTLETGVTTVRDLNASNDMDFAMRELTRTGARWGHVSSPQDPECPHARVLHRTLTR